MIFFVDRSYFLWMGYATREHRARKYLVVDEFIIEFNCQVYRQLAETYSAAEGLRDYSGHTARKYLTVNEFISV